MSLLGQLKQEIDASSTTPAEVIVVDNGSSDQTVDLADLVTGIQVIRTVEPLGYVKACNLGAERARGEILVFLNNDIELTPGLLDRVPGTFDAPEVGACGARIVNTAGMLQEAGSFLWPNGSGNGLGRGQDPTEPIYLIARDVDYVSGCFLCVRRDLFEKIGGFDLQFSPGYYEDTDLCLQIKARGYRVVYDPSLVIYHYEYASYSSGRPPTVSRLLMRQNQEKFRAKHQAALAGRVGSREVSPVEAAFGAAPDQQPRRILFIEDAIPRPRSGSGFTAASDIIRDMVDSGMIVTVWSLHERGELAFPLWTVGAQALLPEIGGDGTVAEHLARNGDRYDVIWICRTHNYRRLCSTLQGWRDEKRGRRLILDTEAIESTREASLAERLGQPWDAEELMTRIRSEVPQLSHVDRVVTKNAIDAKALEKACAVSSVVLGHRFEPATNPPGPEGRQGLLFVGALYGEDTPNYDSLRWFIHDVLPLIDKAIPGIEFHIVGYRNRAVAPIETSLASQVVWHGAADDLQQFWDLKRVFVAPTRYAGGLPHKVQNAMSGGIPVVCTPLLWQQLADDERMPATLAPSDWSPARFAECVTRLYLDDALWRSQQERGIEYVKRLCSPDSHRSIIMELIHG